MAVQQWQKKVQQQVERRQLKIYHIQGTLRTLPLLVAYLSSTVNDSGQAPHPAPIRRVYAAQRLDTEIPSRKLLGLQIGRAHV